MRHRQKPAVPLGLPALLATYRQF